MQANFQTYNSSEELEHARAVEAGNTSYTERFRTLMRLIKVSAMLKNATIISSPTLPETKE